MYKQVETSKYAILDNGATFTPVATLKSDAGGVCHISIDDHCYKLTLMQDDGTFKVTPYIFQEAFEILRNLPDLVCKKDSLKTDEETPGKFQLDDMVVNPEVYYGNEKFKVVGIRKDEIELEGDWSGGTNAVCEKCWMKIEGWIKI